MVPRRAAAAKSPIAAKIIAYPSPKLTSMCNNITNSGMDIKAPKTITAWTFKFLTLPCSSNIALILGQMTYSPNARDAINNIPYFNFTPPFTSIIKTYF
jgi:hypothetical protein